VGLAVLCVALAVGERQPLALLVALAVLAQTPWRIELSGEAVVIRPGLWQHSTMKLSDVRQVSVERGNGLANGSPFQREVILTDHRARSIAIGLSYWRDVSSLLAPLAARLESRDLDSASLDAVAGLRRDYEPGRS
jgi:hypothetical protein